MAHGIELIFGFCYSDSPELFSESVQELGLDLDTSRESHEYLKPDEDKLKVNLKLREIHLRCLKDMGFKVNKNSKNRYVNVETPLGEREFVPFDIELFLDPHEMGEDINCAVFGVSISGRYFPTFADWRSKHGTIYPLSFNEEVKKCMEIASKHIMEEFPIFKKANWIVKEIWY
jgi:hypothetical protein